VIAIVDYGAGNLRSVQNTLDAIGAEYALVRDAGSLDSAAKIILPGVGHFGQMMRALSELKLGEALNERLRSGVPFLGICLGMQALFEGSEEAPDLPGFALFEGTVKRFSSDVRVPHMGWNEVEACASGRLIQGRPYLYFAHSFYAPLVNATSAVCEYGVRYTAAIEHGNVFGVQFHPEKSGAAGLDVMRRFVDLPC
jgi:imidazole glycerol phosphate synthase glutamine amidotransferase subunit